MRGNKSLTLDRALLKKNLWLTVLFLGKQKGRCFQATPLEFFAS